LIDTADLPYDAILKDAIICERRERKPLEKDPLQTTFTAQGSDNSTTCPGLHPFSKLEGIIHI